MNAIYRKQIAKAETISIFQCSFQDESSYVLNEALTTTNLIDFVYNYTTKKIMRHLRHDNNAKHSHFFNATNSQNFENYQPTIDRNNVSRKMETVSIAILSSENFTNVIFDPHRVSIQYMWLKQK